MTVLQLRQILNVADGELPIVVEGFDGSEIVEIDIEFAELFGDRVVLHMGAS